MPTQSLASVVYNLGRYFKALPADKLEDMRPADRELFGKAGVDRGKLPDSETTSRTDIWSDTSERSVDGARDGIGAASRMSGTGAEDMSDMYADDVQPAGLSRQYQIMADEMKEQRAMIRAALKGLSMLTEQVAILAGTSKADDRFPKSEVEDEDEKDDDESERKAAEGYAVVNSSVKNLFDRIAGVSTGQTRKGARSARPPSFHEMTKGATSLESLIESAEARGATGSEIIEISCQWQRAKAVAAGRADPSILTQPSAMRSATIRELFALHDPRFNASV